MLDGKRVRGQSNNGVGMARKNKKIERRKFIESGLLASAAAIVTPGLTAAQQTSPVSAEDGDVLTTDSCGSDYMVDVIKSLGFDYVCANPGSSFRGVHES